MEYQRYITGLHGQNLATTTVGSRCDLLDPEHSPLRQSKSLMRCKRKSHCYKQEVGEHIEYASTRAYIDSMIAKETRKNAARSVRACDMQIKKERTTSGVKNG